MGRMNRAVVATAPRKLRLPNTQEGKFITFPHDLMLNHRNMDRVGVAIDCNGITIDGHYPINRGDRGAYYYDCQKDAEPDRQTCWQPRAHAPDDVVDEPGEARRRSRPDVSTSPEIRERHQSDRRQPAAAHFEHPSGARRILLRGRAERPVGNAPRPCR